MKYLVRRCIKLKSTLYVHMMYLPTVTMYLVRVATVLELEGTELIQCRFSSCFMFFTDLSSGFF